MHLKGKEKHFWRNNFSISKLDDIPQEIGRYRSMDSEADDQQLFYLTSRIPVIHEIYLKFTDVTDEGVKHISNLKTIFRLTLRDHKGITNESLPYLNKLSDLEYLDILKTAITLEDLPGLSALHNLKELHVSSENTDSTYLLSHVAAMKELLPECVLYINYQSYE